MTKTAWYITYRSKHYDNDGSPYYDYEGYIDMDERHCTVMEENALTFESEEDAKNWINKNIKDWADGEMTPEIGEDWYATFIEGKNEQ